MAGPSRWSVLVDRTPLLVGALAVLALIYFDLGPPLTSNDDWLWGFTAKQWMLGHGLHVYPMAGAMALVQIVWSILFTLGHPDQQLLRLSVVPFVLLGAACSFRLALDLGASRFWSGVSAVALVASPLFLANTTSFMTDATYSGLLMAFALLANRWISRGKSRAATVIVAILCPLQRQVGVLNMAALTAGLLIARRTSRRDLIALATGWAGAVAALVVPLLIPGLANRPFAAKVGVGGGLGQHLLPLALLPAMIGLCLIPFLAGLAFTSGSGRAPGRRARPVGPLLTAGIAFAAVCAVAIGFNRTIFPGNVWTRLGFTPDLQGGKLALFADPPFVGVEVLAMVTVAAIVLCRSDRHVLQLGAGGIFLVALSAAQFLPLLALQTYPYDRYYLAVAAPAMPLVAALVTGSAWPRLAGVWAATALLAGIVLYAIGEQDYQAWQVARDKAAQLAYQLVPPSEVQAGYPANAVYAALPYYERTGSVDWLEDGGPPHPRLTLLFAQPGDPRPGVDYQSLRPGRIVIDAK